MKRWALFSGFLLTGCATTINPKVPFDYQATRLDGAVVTLRLGLERLEDRRPMGDRVNLKELAQVAEPVTRKLAEDLLSSGVFKEVAYPPTVDADLMIRGRIDRFGWGVNTTPAGYFILPALFGATSSRVEAVAGLTLECYDRQSGQILKRITAQSTQAAARSWYGSAPADGAELAQALKEVDRQLAEQLRAFVETLPGRSNEGAAEDLKALFAPISTLRQAFLEQVQAMAVFDTMKKAKTRRDYAASDADLTKAVEHYRQLSQTPQARPEFKVQSSLTKKWRTLDRHELAELLK